MEVDEVRGQRGEVHVRLSCTVLTSLSGYQGDYCGAATASFDPVGVTVSTCWICFCQTPRGFFCQVHLAAQEVVFSFAASEKEMQCCFRH